MMEYNDLKKGMKVWLKDNRYPFLNYVKKTKVISFNREFVVFRQGFFSDEKRMTTEIFIKESVEV
ncbi:MAG: hypothetical protein NE328_19190 [Lentisphaeraceae bacterium]|nr:hypothetical protein [Lentisphaeraceae bacterium]